MNECRGSCFDPNTHEKLNKECPCVLASCPCCKINCVQWTLDCNMGYCGNCAVMMYAKGRCTHNPNTKQCEYCGNVMQPIGTSRVNGNKKHDDWGSRKYHKKCWLEMKRNGDL